MATSVTSIPAAPASVTYIPPASSQTGQVNLLNQHGERPAEIAAILSLPVATVDGDSGIAVPETASIQVPSQAPALAQSGSAKSVISIFG